MRKSGGKFVYKPAIVLVFLAVTFFSSFASAAVSDSGESGEKGGHNQNEISNPPTPSFLRKSPPETHYVYMNLKKSAQLQCENVELSSVPENLAKNSSEAIKWYKTSPNKVDMSAKCLDTDDDDDEDDHDDDDHKNDKNESDEKYFDKLKCSYIYSSVNNSKSLFYSKLRLRKLQQSDYGEYECHRVGGQQLLRKFVLRGEIRATRKSKAEKPETERSVFVNVGMPLHLYCNYSQGESDKYINISDVDYVTVSWFRVDATGVKDENGNMNRTDITSDLRNKTDGEYQNFTEIHPYQFLGTAKSSHRAEYVCSINLKPHSKNIIHEKMFPVEYKFNVRVQGSDKWIYPAGILLVEIICMGIFTAIIWRRDDAKEKSDDVGVPQDSDDDEEESPKLK